MSVIDADEPKRKAPYFFPALYLQRRSFIVETLRKEGVRSVVELGCGEGSILSALCQPASQLDDVPTDIPLPDSTNNATASALYQKLHAIQPPLPEDKELHLSKLAGLDISLDSLGYAITNTAPLPATNVAKSVEEQEYDDLHGYAQEHLRWEKLKIELWHGSLDVYNEQLDNFECMFASEVVEHLYPSALNEFGRVVLGTYRPRLVIVTTPNYDFHPYFPQTSASGDEDQHKFPDPTGRSDRIFRDADHKFEMTTAEFQNWCCDLGSEYDYTPTFTGVGSLRSYRKDLRDQPGAADLYATQIAIFRRVYTNSAERSPRSPQVVPLPFYSTPLKTQADPSSRLTKSPHILIHTHQYDAVLETGQVTSLEKIRDAIGDVFWAMGYNRSSLRTLWGRNYLTKKCGGSMARLIQAIAESEDGLITLCTTPDSRYRGIDAIEVIYNGKLYDSDVDSQRLDKSEESDVSDS